MISILLLIVSLSIFSNAQVINLGPCPEVQVVPNLNISEYLGTWYQISRYPNFFEKGNCSSAVYGPIENGIVKVRNAEIVNGNHTFIEGTAEFANPNSSEAKLIVKFHKPDTLGSYWVLGTDYQNYSVVWSCSSYALFNIQFAWVLAREKPLSSELSQSVVKIFEENSLSSSQLVIRELPECKNLP